MYANRMLIAGHLFDRLESVEGLEEATNAMVERFVVKKNAQSQLRRGKKLQHTTNHQHLREFLILKGHRRAAARSGCCLPFVLAG